METRRRRESLYPRRIAGISFGEEDYQRIQETCKRYDMSEAQLVRGTVTKGLGAFEEGLHEKIQEFATEFGIPEHMVVSGAIKEGLDEYLRMSRSKRRLEQLRQFREELGEEDRDLDLALREYLKKHSELEDLLEEEEFFQKTINREDEIQRDEDQERQADFDEFVRKQSDS